ncbi:hypothetical protein T484DRAFT_1915855, partial [Baffinella frigidus]
MLSILPLYSNVSHIETMANFLVANYLNYTLPHRALANRAGTGSASITNASCIETFANYSIANYSNSSLAYENSTVENATFLNDTFLNDTVINDTCVEYTLRTFLNGTQSTAARSLANRAGTGSASITVYGMGFGHSSLSSGFRVGQTACEDTSWESATSVRCRVVQGAFGTQRVALTVGARGGTVTEAVTYDAAHVSHIRKTNVAVTGSMSMTVHGMGFAASLHTMAMRIGGGTACEWTEWASETMVFCMMTPGVQGTRRVVVTVGERVGTVTEAWSLDAPMLSVTTRQNRAGTGSASITVHGSNFGHTTYTGAARVGDTACEITGWESASAVRCQVSASVSGSRRVALTVGDRGGSATEVWSVDLPKLSVMTRQNRAGTGSASVTVHGSSFGHTTYTVSVRVGATVCESTEWVSASAVRCRVPGGVSGFGSTVCESSVWVSWSAVRCRVSAGVPGSRRIMLTVFQHGGSVTEAWSTDVPMLSILPLHFNLSEIETMANFSIGNYSNYTLPSRALANRAGTGSTSLTVRGMNFGHATYSGAVRSGFTACESTGWESASAVRCRMPVSISGTRRVALTVGVRAGSVTEAWSLDVATISNLVRMNHPSTGSVSVTIRGAHMSVFQPTHASRVGFTSCESSTWTSSTSVACRPSHGLASTRRIAVTAGIRTGCITEAFSYASPLISSLDMTRSNCPAAGNCIMYIYGSGFGVDDFTPMARVGRTACLATPWTSESSIQCKIPRGTGLYASVMVTAGARSGSASWAFSYDAPFIQHSSLRFLDGGGTQVSEREITLDSTEGNVTVAFEGQNFGPGFGDIAVTFGHPAIAFPGGFDAYICDVDPRTNDTLIVCRVPPGIGFHHRFHILVDRNTAAGTDLFNYPPPSLVGGTLRIIGGSSAGTDVNGTSTVGGTDAIELTGVNFGPYSKDVHVSFGPLPSASRYLCTVFPIGAGIAKNHTTIQCLIASSGVGTAHVFNLTVGRQSA